MKTDNRNQNRHGANASANNAKPSGASAQRPDMTPIEDAEILDDIEEAQGETPTEEAAEMIQDELTIVDRLNNELNDTKAALDKEKNEYLKLMAEFDNFRKRNVKERADLIRNAAENTMKNLLPIVDDIERGLSASKEVNDAASIRQGMELIFNKLLKLLENNGVKPIESTGKPFDPETEEAIAMVPAQDDAQKGVVIDTPTKGYTINDKILRHAKVVVGQ